MIVRRRRPEPIVIHKPKLDPVKPPPKPKPPKPPAPAPRAPELPRVLAAGAIPGRLDVALRIDRFPTEIRTMPNGWKQFEVDCGPGWVFTVTLRPRIFARLEEARASGGEWGASIGGKMGERTKLGFVLEQPGVQAFVKKPKATADAAQAPAVEEAAPIAASATGPTEAVGASAAQAESPRPE